MRFLLRSNLLILILISILFTGCRAKEEVSKDEQAEGIQQENKIEKINAEINKVDEILPKKEKASIEPEEIKEPKELVISFMGDVMMDSFIGDYIRDYGSDYPWTDVAPITKESDLAIINLETSVSTRGETKKPEGYGFRSHPDTLQGLVNSGIDMVSLANNHTLDFGEEAFFDTLESLNQYGIAYVGGGKNKREAEEAKILEKNGFKMGFVAYTSVIPWSSWEAGEDKPGTAVLKMEYKEKILKNIQDASKKCDRLTVLLHWGVEYDQAPSEKQRELAHAMIDAGADIIVGHHPHILQGIEFYKEKPIFYSIGNFVFLKNDELCGKTGIFTITVDENGFKSGTFDPVHIQYCKANLLHKNEGQGKEIIDMLRKLSSPWGTIINENGEIRKP